MSRGPAWTEREDALICEHFGRIRPHELLQMLPGRTMEAIYDRCKKLRAAGMLQRVRRPAQASRGKACRIKPLQPPPATRRRHDAQMQQAFSQATVDMHRGPAHLPGEPVITEHTRIVRVAAPVDQRFAPEGKLRVVDASECRPWAMAVCACGGHLTAPDTRPWATPGRFQ